MNIGKPEKKEIMILMAAGCLLGILCFAMIYGFKIVNPTYDGWIFFGDIDLQQHYVGFCHFRNSPWTFPIGLTDSLSVPYSMSVVYTDSIPLFALLFKIFRSVLPIHFQYFGLFGLISFMLMGALSTILIRRFSNNKLLCIGGSLFFILSFPILQRLFYHTALSAQWIIVLALIAWFYTDINDREQTKKICIYWALIGVLSVLIHSYFVFMTGIVLLAQIAEGVIREKKLRVNQLLPLLFMGISSFVVLYVLGGFYGKGSVSGYGFGVFNANMTAFINPMHYSRLIGEMPLNGMFEYEGFAYLGAGILALTIIGVVFFIKKCVNDKRLPMNSKRWVIFATVIIVLLFSCFPKFSFTDFTILEIPVPKIIQKIFGICRTNARFVWVGMYLIIITALWFVSKYIDKTWMKLVFAFAIVLQLFDVSNTAKNLNSRYSEDLEYVSAWKPLERYEITKGKDQFVFMYDDSDLMMDTGFYGYLHGLSQNSFYYARTIYDDIDRNIAEWSEKFLSGDINDNVIYVFRDEDYTTEYNDAAAKADAKVFQFEGHIAVIK